MELECRPGIYSFSKPQYNELPNRIKSWTHLFAELSKGRDLFLNGEQTIETVFVDIDYLKVRCNHPLPFCYVPYIFSLNYIRLKCLEELWDAHLKNNYKNEKNLEIPRKDITE